MNPVYCALFEGQGSWLTSQGLFPLRDKIRALGARADVYAYTQGPLAHLNLTYYRAHDSKIALWGFSLGTSEALYEQDHFPPDSLMCCAVSQLETTWKINPATKHSILWYGPGTLSSGGTNLGFDVMIPIAIPRVPILGHMLMQVSPTVITDTLEEIRLLQQGV